MHKIKYKSQMQFTIEISLKIYICYNNRKCLLCLIYTLITTFCYLL